MALVLFSTKLWNEYLLPSPQLGHCGSRALSEVFTSQTPKPLNRPLLVGAPKIYEFFKVVRKFSKLLRIWEVPQKVRF